VSNFEERMEKDLARKYPFLLLSWYAFSEGDR